MFGGKFPPVPFLVRKMLRFEEGRPIQLEIRSQSFAGGTITIRGMTREGIFSFVHTTVNDGSLQTETFGIPDIPIAVTVLDRTGSREQGKTYVVLNLMIEGEVVQELTAGLVHRDKGITYPTTNAPDQRPSQGEITSLALPNPAAGSEINLLFSSNRSVRVLWVRFRLVTSAVAANRRVHIVFQSSAGVALDCFSDVDQTASQNILYSCAAYPALPTRADDNDILIPIPPNIILTGEAEIKTQTTNLQAGDDFGVGDVVVESFLQRL